MRSAGADVRATLQRRSLRKGSSAQVRKLVAICLSGTFPRQSGDQSYFSMAIMQCHILQSQRNKFQTCRTQISSACQARCQRCSMNVQIQKGSQSLRTSSASLLLPVQPPRRVACESHGQALSPTQPSCAGTLGLEKK